MRRTKSRARKGSAKRPRTAEELAARDRALDAAGKRAAEAIEKIKAHARGRVQAQLDKANAERARGNEYGYEYHRARAADLAALPSLGGAPGTISRVVETVKRIRDNSAKARAQAVAARGVKATAMKAKARAAMKERLQQGRSYRVIARELVKEFTRSRRTISNWTGDLKPQKRK